MIAARNRRDLQPADLALFYETVQRAVDARGMPLPAESPQPLLTQLRSIVDTRRSWTAFTALELEQIEATHNALIVLLALDNEDKISCVRSRVTGSRITATNCAAWGN